LSKAKKLAAQLGIAESIVPLLLKLAMPNTAGMELAQSKEEP
jgi:hypothetical protein